MATIVDEVPKGKYTKYPWEEWFDGQIRKFTYGTDFFTSTKSFYSVIQQAAAVREVKVLITQQAGDLYMQRVDR